MKKPFEKFSKIEKEKLNDCWIFIELFKTTAEKSKSVSDFRIEIIKLIKKNYTIEEFYLYEKILNKLVYNLLYKYNIVNYNKSEIKDDIFVSFPLSESSYANKLLLYDEKNNKLIYVKNYKDILNQPITKLINCLQDKETYNAILNKENIKLKNLNTYYPYDYPFPNINLFFYNQNSKETWIRNIKHMYYSKNAEKNWRINLYENQILKCLKTIK
jgi:hypothetical protein